MREVRVAFRGDRRALSAITVRRVVNTVLDGERKPDASISVTFLSVARMRGLNQRVLRADRATDVIAFDLSHLRSIVGDVYICPSVGRRSARSCRIPAREEFVRLVVHGVLHVLGYDHPRGRGRTSSPMWQRQERYVAHVMSARS